MTMLGKTAGGLFWMFRYLERSETSARLVEAGQRIALTRSHSDDEWQSVLQTAAGLGSYLGKYGDVTKDNAIDWMLRDKDNPSSVLNVIENARNNARLVRTDATRRHAHRRSAADSRPSADADRVSARCHPHGHTRHRAWCFAQMRRRRRGGTAR